jgi:polar amino acid transport system substrate-binding protein
MSKYLRAIATPIVVAVLALLGAAPLDAQAPPAAGEAEGGQALSRRAVIRFLTEGDYPPFNYLDEDNVLTGFNVDMARAVCLELAAACDIQVRPWSELVPALRRGEADAIIASHAIGQALLKVVDFTDRYYHTPGRFAGPRNSGRLDVTPEGLEGRRIAVAKGTAHEAYLRAFFSDSSIRAFETPELARDALITGAADLLFDDGVSLVFWLNGTASKGCCEFKGGPFSEPKYFGDGVAIVVGREDQQLKSLINAALKHIRSTGRYEELLLRYFPLRAF